MKNIIKLKFDSQKAGGTKGVLTAMKDGKTLCMNTIDLANEDQRNKILQSLESKCQNPLNEEEKTDIHKSLMQKASQQLSIAGQRQKAQIIKPAVPPLEQSRTVLSETEPELIKKAKEFLTEPNLLQYITDHIRSMGVTGEEELALFVYLIGTSRLLAKPLAGIVIGRSSGGKSYVIYCVGRLFPDEAVMRAHRMSSTALNYMPDDSLIHRFVIAGERSRKIDDGAAEITRNLREMLSDGRLSAVISVKSESGGHEAIHIEKEGPIAYIESTTLRADQILDEDKTRLLLLSTDETEAHTAAIIDQMAKDAAKPSKNSSREEIISLHHTAQRLLKPCDVVIPFADELKSYIPTKNLWARRAFPQLLSLIKAITLLHQYQRRRDKHGRVIASADDYEIVKTRFGGILEHSMGGMLSPSAAKTLDHIKKSSKDGFTIETIVVVSDCGETTVRKNFKDLESAGKIIVKSAGKGPHSTVYAIAGNLPSVSGEELPDIETVEELPDKEYLEKELDFLLRST